MRIAIIGVIASGGCGSFAYRLATILSHKHTVYEFPTQELDAFDGCMERRVYPISVILGDKTEEIEYIIVTQSHILIHNNTEIPLLLYKQEHVDPLGTVDNATYTLKKLERMKDYNQYKHVVFSAINLHLYNPDRKKDILLLDVPWLPLPFDEYRDRLERAQHVIIMQRVHEIDCFTARVLEAMACKTIPIIFYKNIGTKKLYELMGINEEVAYFVSVDKYTDLQIIEYNEHMANIGYELVKESFGMETRAKEFMEVLLNET